MSIRRNLIAYLALFIALGGTSYAAVGAAAPSAARGAEHRSASPGCYPKGSGTIAQDRAGRFFHIARSWYVCAFKEGTPRKLPFGGHPDSATPWDPSAKVTGSYVAFFTTPLAPGVAVFDMRTGHETFFERSPVGTTGSPVVKSDGSVAWISGGGEVNRHDSTGTAVVDSGREIDPRSLAAGGSWLYWTNAGSPRSTPFH